MIIKNVDELLELDCVFCGKTNKHIVIENYLKV